jgi:hypothetical protein
VWPGIRLHSVGDCTAGLQMVTGETPGAARWCSPRTRRTSIRTSRRGGRCGVSNLPEMLTAFDTIDRLARPAKLTVSGDGPQVADRFKPVEPGIKIV